MEIDFKTHTLIGDAVMDTFKEYVNETVKKIKEQSSEPECAIKEHVIKECAAELHKLESEIYYEQADFLATAGDNGGEE